MDYELKPSHFFLQQIDELGNEAKKVVEDKLRLVKVNPFRNKRIQGHGLFLFRIRLRTSAKRKESFILLISHT